QQQELWIRVHDHPVELRAELHTDVSDAREVLLQTRQQIAQSRRLDVWREASRLEPAEAEHVVYQEGQVVDLRDHARRVVARGRRAVQPALQGLCHHAQPGERRAQLV